MTLEQNEVLTKAMGLCWHESELVVDGYSYWRCKFCHVEGRDRTNIDFSTPDGFFELWGWTHQQDWWYLFYDNHLSTYRFVDLIHPDKFADAVYNFLINRDK